MTRGNQSNGSKTRLCNMHHGWLRVSPGATGSITASNSRNICVLLERMSLSHKTRILPVEHNLKLQERCRISNYGLGSERLYSSTTSTPLIRLDIPVNVRRVSNNILGSPSSHAAIPLKGSCRRTLHTPASPSSIAKSSTTKRPISSSSPPRVSQGASAGSAQTNSSVPSNWQFPQKPRPSAPKPRQSIHHEPLPLPLAIMTFRTSLTIPSTAPSLSLTGAASSTTRSQLIFPPPPAVLGSQPLYYLARRFPLLAEQELKAIPNKTALDYSSFLLGAMETSYPSATTLRAVLRQFRTFLKDSSRNLKASDSSSSSSSSSTRLELPRARIWAQMIRGLIWLKQYRRARVAVHVMQKFGIKPTGYAWRGICRGWIEQGQLDRAEALAVKVFTRPEISNDYNLDEKPYYFTDMQEEAELGRRRRRSPMSPNSAPLFLVIEALTECGEMERARHWFDRIPEHEITDLLTSDMVAGYLRIGQQDKVQEVIRVMARCGVKPTAIVFNPIVEHAAKNIGMEAAEDLVRDMIQLGIFLNLFTYKILICGYIAAGQKDKALECLDRIRASGIEPDRALGRILLDGAWSMGTLRKGDHGRPPVCKTDRAQGVKDPLELEELDFVGKPGWSQQCVELIQQGDLELAEEALQQALESRTSTIDPETIRVIEALADRQEMTRARHWFDRLVLPDHVSNHRPEDNTLLARLLNRMVSGYIQTQRRDQAEAVIGIMWQYDVRPTVDTINLMLQWSTIQADMQEAETLVQSMSRSGILPNQQTYEILCKGYASRGAIESLQECLERMDDAGFGGSHSSLSINELRADILGQSEPLTTNEEQVPGALQPTSPSSNILDTLCQRWIEHDNMAQADQFVDHLLSNPNVPGHKIPFSTLIQGWIDQSQRNTISSSAIEAIAQSSSSSPTVRSSPSSSGTPASSSVPSSRSLNQEARLREESVAKMRMARSWFDRVPEGERNLDLVNRMIGGYMALGLEQESEELVQWLASRKIKPDATTYNHILEHTIQRLSMPTAEGLVSTMQKGGIMPNVDTWNLLIRGYVIRGELSQALRCLDRMTGKKVALSSSPASFEKTSSRYSSQGRKSKTKTREIMETYDREILDVVALEEDKFAAETEFSSESSKQRTRPSRLPVAVEPNELTEQLILSGFGPELKPLQGRGDYARALGLYKNRVERQRQQSERLLQGLASLNQQNPILPKPTLGSERVRPEMEDEDSWILDHVDALQGMKGSDLGMTDLDWKSELKWEEMMEIEKVRERELSGQSISL
ncbi:hypothetical protein BGX27_010902 [Mortierella sp. AM989]|nr:hypothetical protein BGX27_010902 [Mortierella sp. AM989]